MKKLYLFIYIMTVFIGCEKSARTAQPKPPDRSVVIEQEESGSPEVPVEELSLKGLVGKWLLLDFEGEVDPSGDHLLIEKTDDKYMGVLVYQGTTRQCTLVQEEKEYFVIAETGERYEVSRIRSVYVSEHNGIGLALVVKQIDDITLGTFQREDVLKELKN